MAKVITECPCCGGELRVSVLRCSDCGMELHNDFQRSPFDLLTAEQTEFLFSFLKHRGNMSSVREELGISYQISQKKLDSLLSALKLSGDTLQEEKREDDIDMLNWFIPKDSHRASDIIKQKLVDNGGRATVYTLQGLPSEIRVAPDGISFLCDKLPTYEYKVFDIIVDFLVSRGGCAEKGNGRNCKLGEPNCDETTVVGTIGYEYFDKKSGASVLDPVFILAAVLEWAGIAHNKRGELVLTDEYMSKL